MKKNKNAKTWLYAVLIMIAAVPVILVLADIAINRQNGGGQSIISTPVIDPDDPAFAPIPTPVPEATAAPTAPLTMPPTPPQTPRPSPSPNPSPSPEPEAPGIVDITADGELSQILDGIAEEYNCAAVSLAAFDGSGTYYTYYYGYADIGAERMADDETKFRVASLSKIVVAICALRMVDDGLLDLDEDISAYLGYEVRNPLYINTPITVRMLLQHTSSIYDSEAFENSRSAGSATRTSTRNLLDAGTSFAQRSPGSSFGYTNFGISVLAAVCEEQSGMLLDSLARALIFTPLGIDASFTPADLTNTENIAVIYNENHRTGRSIQAQLENTSSYELGRDHHLAQGNLTISALDYAKILSMLCSDGVYGDVRILSSESVQEMHNADIYTGSYMQGLAVRFRDGGFMGEDVYWHTGSAYGELTQFVYDLDTGRIVVAITTGSDSGRQNGMVRVCTELSEPVWEMLR